MSSLPEPSKGPSNSHPAPHNLRLYQGLTIADNPTSADDYQCNFRQHEQEWRELEAKWYNRSGKQVEELFAKGLERLDKLRERVRETSDQIAVLTVGSLFFNLSLPACSNCYLGDGIERRN